MQKNRKPQRCCAVCFGDLSEGLGLIDALVYSGNLCLKCRNELKSKIRKVSIGPMKVYALYEYNPKIRSLIIQYKDFNDRYLARIFLEPFRLRLALFYNDFHVVCVPSADLAVKQRGFDHIALMASFLGLKILSPVLVNRAQRKQKEQSRLERLTIKKYIKLVDSTVIQDKKIILVDDVMTTGSTLRACYELLQPFARRIVVLVVASVSSDVR